MKVFVQSADDRMRIDGSIQCNLVNHFQNIVSSVAEADVCLVVISFFHDYKFNPKLWSVKESGKPYVFIDFTELEWCYFNEKNETHLFGKNTPDMRWLNPNWDPLDEWVRNHPPLMYFKRELLAKDASDTVKPISWPCYLPEAPFQDETDFNNRPVECLWVWGHSHPSRPKLHGDIFHGMNTHGLGVISATEQFEGHFRDHPHARTWMTVFTPWHSRKPIADLLWYQMRSKISVSLFGCGRVCFRHTESPVGSIMAKQRDGLAWPFAWENGINCIELEPDHEFRDLEAATHRDDLYPIYVESHRTIDKYRGKRLVTEYMAPLIQSKLGIENDTTPVA